VLHAQCTSALPSGVPILQGNAEALDRWCGKAKDRLIFYFLSNTSAKNYHNWIMYVKIIASQRRDVFETQCESSLYCSSSYYCCYEIVHTVHRAAAGTRVIFCYPTLPRYPNSKNHRVCPCKFCSTKTHIFSSLLYLCSSAEFVTNRKMTIPI